MQELRIDIFTEHMIKVDMRKNNVPILAYSGEKFDKMCKGKNSRMFVSVGSSEGRVLELDCSKIPFELVQAMSLGLEVDMQSYSLIAPGGTTNNGRSCFCDIFTSRGDISGQWSFSLRSTLTDLDVLSRVYLFLRGGNFTSRGRIKYVH